MFRIWASDNGMNTVNVKVIASFVRDVISVSFSQYHWLKFSRSCNRQVFYARRKIGSVFPHKGFYEKWSNELEHKPHHSFADTRARARSERKQLVPVVPKTKSIKGSFINDVTQIWTF